MISKKISFWLTILLFIVLFCHVSCSKSRETRFEESVTQGNTMYARREYKAALNSWEEALKIQPTSISVLKNIAQTYLCLAEFLEAKKVFIKIIQLQPQADDILLELTKLQLVTGEFDDAVTNWNKLNARHPNDSTVKALYGDFLMIEGHYREAEDAYKNAIRISSNNKVVLIKLATCYLSQEKIEMAQQIFEMATANTSESIDVLLQIANYWKLKNEMENAELYIRKAIQLEPENLSLQMKLVQFYFNNKKYQDSSTIIDKLIKLAPENIFFKKYQIKILLSQKKLEKISILLKKYQMEMENDLEFNLLAGKYYLFINYPIIAEEHFKRVIREKSNHYIAHYYLGVAYLLSNHSYLAQLSFIDSLSFNPSFFEAEIALADIYYKKYEFDFSHEHIKRVIAKAPENFRAHMVMGNVLFAKNQYKEALSQFRLASFINPDSESSVYYIALTCEYLKEDVAIDLYQALLKKNPLLVDVAWRLKELLIRKGKIDIARQYFKSAVELYPKNGYLHYILGEIHLSNGNISAAIDCFNNAIDLLPELTSSYIGLFEIYGKNKNWEKQIDILKLCLKNVPDFLDCYIKLSEIYRQNGKVDEAIKVLEIAFSNTQSSPVLANNLAYLYLEKDQNMNKAFELARFSYEHMPENPAVIDSLGWVYYKKKMFSQAIIHLEKACSIAPLNPIVHYHLGQALLAVGKHSEGHMSLQKAISLNLSSPYLEKAEKLLEIYFGSGNLY